MPYFIRQTNNSPFLGLDFAEGVSPIFTDLDGDGLLDLVVGTDSGDIYAYRNTGDHYEGIGISGLTDVNFGTTVSPTFADIDGDGDDDAIISLNNGQFRYLQNNGGTFTELTDSENPLDAFFKSLQQSRNQLSQTLPIAPVSSEQPTEPTDTTEETNDNTGGSGNTPLVEGSITYVDIDGDGDDDKLVLNADSTADVYLNDAGNYTFASTVEVQRNDVNPPVVEEESGNAVTEENESDPSTALQSSFVDIDGDGDLDALVSHSNGAVDIYLKTDGDYVFDSTLETGEKGASPVLADIDGDGDLDALVGTDAGRLLYYRREIDEEGNKSFVRQTGKDNPLQYVDVGYDAKPSFADIDGDGDPDLVIGNRDGELLHYDNYTPTPSVSKFVSHHYQHFDYDSGWTSDDKWPRHLADVNGDGRADIVAFGGSVVQVALGQEDGSFGTKSTAYDRLTYNNGGWTSQKRNPRHLADVNGDGRADIVAFGGSGVYVALAQQNEQGDITFADHYKAYDRFTSNGGWTSDDKWPRHLADVNGDGRADIVAFGGSGVYVALAQQSEQGDITFADHYKAYDRLTYNHGWTSQDRNPRHLADVNGDGRADIVAFGASGVYVALGQSDGKFGKHFKAYNDFTSNGGWTSDDKWPSHLADVNGDGRDDIVVFGTGGVAVAMGQSDGTFQKHTRLTDRFTHLSGGWTSQNKYPRHLADVNGDGLADLVGFGHSSVKVRQNNTVRPDPAADLFFESEFTSTGKSIWHNGDAFHFDWDLNRDLGVGSFDWNMGNYSQEFGGFVELDSGGSEGEIDVNAGIEINSGSIDTALPLITWFGMTEENPVIGSNLMLKTGSFLSEEAQFETLFPYVKAYFDANLDIFAGGPSLTFDVPLVGELSLSSPSIDIDEQIAFFFDSSGDKSATIDIEDYASFEVQPLEEMNLTSSRVDDFTLKATSSTPFFKGVIDLDNIISEVTPLPSLEYSDSWDFGVGSAWGSLNAFDVDLVTEFTVEQTLTLTVDSITGELTFENGETQQFNFGDDIDFLLSSGVDVDGDGHANIEVSVTPQISIQNSTSILYDLDLVVSAAAAAAGFDVGIDLGPFGSINYSDSITVDSQDWIERLGIKDYDPYQMIWGSHDLVSGGIYDYDQTFALDGFGSQSYSFGIEV